MPRSIPATLTELTAVLRNDALRGGATAELLEIRLAAVKQAARAREAFAYREALLELAACATGLAARLPAPAAPVPYLSGTQPRPAGSGRRAA